ncbi:hypothetical protein B0O80DRAFT_421616 [Mortierella sp. GBAus27b]|nr:hypothetical protein BGX31_001004 [Mortierella sp. GBA43]KAI8362026.1 hypothetical protein B0O80DRAFT_421616 [Mortierella sp. GBAus27b]
MGFWSRSPPALTQEYQESVAYRVREILTGEDNTPHKKRNKAAIKALQRPEALAGVIEILKTMPEPPHGSEHSQVDDEGLGLDSEVESGHEQDTKQKEQTKPAKQGNKEGKRVAAQGLFNGHGGDKGVSKSSNINSTDEAPKPKPKHNPTTFMAAATIAAAAATSAAAAALALKKGRKSKQVVHEKEETTVEVDDNTETRTTTKTVVRFRPSKETVSCQTFWWGYEIFIPNPALSRIASAQDVSTAFLGFLGSVGLVVPAIVPFLGYIAAYVGLEFAVIKAQNEGRGVILASTWLVPVALVPRAWDVPDDDDSDST